MAIRATIEYRGLLARAIEPGGLARVFVRAVRKALHDAGIYWRDNVMKRHFEFSAHKRYGYAKRVVSYEIRKAKKYGHRRPLEFSGEAKAQILGFKRQVSVRRGGQDFVVRVPFSAPKHFFQINPRGQQINKPKELTAINEEEIKELALFIDERVGVHLENEARMANRRIRRVA